MRGDLRLCFDERLYYSLCSNARIGHTIPCKVSFSDLCHSWMLPPSLPYCLTAFFFFTFLTPELISFKLKITVMVHIDTKDASDDVVIYSN